jgi:hypothetical protein
VAIVNARHGESPWRIGLPSDPDWEREVELARVELPQAGVEQGFQAGPR